MQYCVDPDEGALTTKKEEGSRMMFYTALNYRSYILSHPHTSFVFLIRVWDGTGRRLRGCGERVFGGSCEVC